MNAAIPQTLEAARTMSGVRCPEWDSTRIQIVADILAAGREVDIMGTVDEFALRIRALDEPRLMNAIGNIAVKLGAKVTNY